MIPAMGARLQGWLCRQVALLLASQLLACGAALQLEGEQHTPYPGDAEAPPTLGALPEMSRPEPELASRQHRALLVAREVLDARLPTAPEDRAFDTLQRWSRGPVADWIRRRRKAVQHARGEFTVGGDVRLRDSIIQHAVVGLLHEDTAAQLAALPSPSELDSEPEVARLYRELVAHHAEPFVAAALVEYRQCADVAYTGPGELRYWGDFCAERFERLKARTLELRAAAGAVAD